MMGQKRERICSAGRQRRLRWKNAAFASRRRRDGVFIDARKGRNVVNAGYISFASLWARSNSYGASKTLAFPPLIAALHLRTASL
jgi:hypothetical protein